MPGPLTLPAPVSRERQKVTWVSAGALTLPY
jgi:hypothetical protein